MNIRKITAIAAAAITALSVSGCKGKNDAKIVEFTDDTGKKIELKDYPQTIISLDAAHTENLYYLDAKHVLSGSVPTVFPPEAAELTRYFIDDTDAIIKAKPDAVLITPSIASSLPDKVKAMEDADITVIALYPETLDEFDNYIVKLAELTDRHWKAEEMLDAFDDEVIALNDAMKNADKPLVYFEQGGTGASDTSMIGAAVAMAGGTNTSAYSADVKYYVTTDKAAERDYTGEVHEINAELIAKPTFRYLTGVKELAGIIHPEIMDNHVLYANDNAATRRSMANFAATMFHIPMYAETDADYYKQEHEGHSYGKFADVAWTDADFDIIEAVAKNGCMRYDKKADGSELFYPNSPVTREELAQTAYILGGFSGENGAKTNIADLAKCETPEIVQTLTDKGIFKLEDGSFNPNRAVTNNEIIEVFEKIR